MNGAEPKGAVDHGGRLEAAVTDDPVPFEGTDWLNDYPNNKGERAVLETPTIPLDDNVQATKTLSKVIEKPTRTVELEGADDHGGRFDATVADDPTPPAGPNWLTDDPDGQGSFTVVDNDKKLRELTKTSPNTNTTAATTTNSHDDDFPETEELDPFAAPFSPDNVHNPEETIEFSSDETTSASNSTPDTLEEHFRLTATITTNATAAYKNIISGINSIMDSFPELLIAASDAIWNSTTDVPSTAKDQKRLLQHFIDDPPGGHKKAVVIFRLRTKTSLSEFPSDKSIAQRLPADRLLRLERNPLGVAKVTRVGLCTSVCPNYKDPTSLQNLTEQLLNAHMTETAKAEHYKRTGSHILQIAIKPKHVSFGEGKERITTKALEISSSLSVAGLIRQSLADISMKGLNKLFTFLPSTLRRENPEVYTQQLRNHNSFLSEVAVLTMYNIKPEILTMDYKSNAGKIHTFEQWCYALHIDSIEYTDQSQSTGKFFFLTTKNKYNRAKAQLEEFISEFDTATAGESYVNDAYADGSAPPELKRDKENTRKPKTNNKSEKTATTSVDNRTSSNAYSSWLAMATSSPSDTSNNNNTQPPANYTRLRQQQMTPANLAHRTATSSTMTTSSNSKRNPTTTPMDTDQPPDQADSDNSDTTSTPMATSESMVTSATTTLPSLTTSDNIPNHTKSPILLNDNNTMELIKSLIDTQLTQFISKTPALFSSTTTTTSNTASPTSDEPITISQINSIIQQQLSALETKLLQHIDKSNAEMENRIMLSIEERDYEIERQFEAIHNPDQEEEIMSELYPEYNLDYEISPVEDSPTVTTALEAPTTTIETPTPPPSPNLPNSPPTEQVLPPDVALRALNNTRQVRRQEERLQKKAIKKKQSAKLRTVRK